MAPVHELKLKFTLDEIEHGHCGTRAWRDWIREINHRVREKSMPRRSLVYIQAHSGLADRLVWLRLLALFSSGNGEAKSTM